MFLNNETVLNIRAARAIVHLVSLLKWALQMNVNFKIIGAENYFCS